jgi:radical SAM superfamily enzyme YgiQ (UPF0313 family)
MSYDILLINAHRDHFGSVAQDVSIGINLLTRFLQENGYQVAMFRGLAHDAKQWMQKTMHADGALSVGFYCDYENLTLVSELSRYVKEQWQIPVFVGGPQAVGLDKNFFRRSLCNAVVLGEGEYTLLELLDGYFRGGKRRSQIAGISYLDRNGNLIQSPHRKTIDNLDALPWPDFRLEQGSRSWNMIPVMTGRGCPFNCAFCYEGGNTKKVRYRSVQNVMDEIARHLERHPHCNYILFIDDTFTLDPRRVEKFCAELARLRREHDFVWFCEGHVQTLLKWPEMLDNMAAAGLAKLVLGIESGSNEVLALYRKKTSAEMIEAVIHKAVSSEIPLLSGNIVIGGPAESPETMRINADFISRLLHIAPGRLDLSAFFLMPYPNTAITRNPEKFGLRLLLDREPHGMADIPLTETNELPWFDLLSAGRELNRKIVSTMKALYFQGKVPHDTIVNSYRLAATYGIVSNWLANVFTASPIAHAYYQLVTRGALKTSREIPPESLHAWHPQRVFSIWDTLSFDSGNPAIGSRVLTPLEYELLIGCSGKLKLSQLLETVYDCFVESFHDKHEFEIRAFELLRNFEDQRWVAFAPI